MRIGEGITEEVGMGARTVVGITACPTESIPRFVAGGTAIAGYVRIELRDIVCKEKLKNMRRGVGSKGQLGRAPK